MLHERFKSVAGITGGGQMGELIRSMDWKSNTLGPLGEWPQSLRTCVATCLESKFPMFVWWGPDLIMLYNDAYSEILGEKHPESLGASGPVIWREVWDVIGPMMNSVLRDGVATWAENQLLLVLRHGFVEECYFTFSYSPARDEVGDVGGVFCAVTETTGQVLSERRMRTLQEISVVTAPATTAEGAARLAARALGVNPNDIPFALLYCIDPATGNAQLKGSSGVTPGDEISPEEIVLDAAGRGWPMAEVLSKGGALVEDLATRFASVPAQGDLPAPERAFVQTLVIPGESEATAILITGLSPRLHYDENYQQFVELVGGAINSAITKARALERESERVLALEEVDRVKTQFFSNVSHEFRTPLTLILGPVEDLLAGVHGQLHGAVKLKISMLHRNALRLQKLVNAILDFSQIEAGRMQAVYRRTDLAQMTRDLSSEFRSAIESAGLRLVVNCEEAQAWVDHGMWEKIVLNLLSNAFKFTFEGEIRVGLCTSDEHVELIVEDTGTGIPEQELPHLFTRFHRIHSARARTHEGSGIGLSLVRELVRLHGGEINVQSVPGQGTRFEIRIPQGRAHLRAEQVVGAHSDLRSSNVNTYVSDALGWLPENTAEADEPVSGNSPRAASRKQSGRVLLVEDNADMIEYIRRMLEPWWEVETCRDPLRALSMACARLPDLVIADVMMPGLDGFGVLEALRSDRRTRDVPVVMLSARAGEEARVEGIKAGASDYLVKPFSARELIARVSVQIELSKTRRRLASERHKLDHIFRQAPVAVAVWRGPQHVFEVANPYYLSIASLAGDVIGKPVRDVFPSDMQNHDVWKIFDSVYATGKTYTDDDYTVEADWYKKGLLEKRRFAFTLAALRDEQQRVSGLIAVVVRLDGDETD